MSKDRAFFVYEFPNWCGFTFETIEGGAKALRLETRHTDHDSKASAHEFQEATAHTAFQLRDLAWAQYQAMNGFAKKMKEVWEAEHTGGLDFDPETDQ
ncbi:MAG: hypothetical protein ACR2RL_21570 [Gammaproteobacteria bacterium]